MSWRGEVVDDSPPRQLTSYNQLTLVRFEHTEASTLMPSDSVASFLDLARSNHLLQPELVDDLFNQSDAPQSNLSSLCDYLVGRGALTRFQADAVAAGRGAELTFAGYPIRDEIGACPGGVAYKATHPTLGIEVVLRRLRTDWLAPFDNTAAYLGRVKSAAAVTHPNLSTPLDAGVDRDEPFVVLEPAEGSDLQSLIDDIGPMPVLLAAEYTRQAARGLEAAHAAGIVHGDVRPSHLTAGPLVQMSKPRADGSPRFRPGPTATVRVREFGLIPVRAKAADWPHDWDTAYLPPERFTSGEHTPAGDVFMLGGVLEFLLTGRGPNSSPLSAVRPDCPTELVTIVEEMRASAPAARPTIASVVGQLEQFLHTGKSLPPPIVPAPLSDSATVPLLETPPEPVQPIGWAAHPSVAATIPTTPGWVATPWSPTDAQPAEESDDAPPVPRRRTERGFSQKKLWIGIGLFLLFNALALLIWAFVLTK